MSETPETIPARGRRTAVLAVALAAATLAALPAVSPAASRAVTLKRTYISSASQEGGLLGYTAQPRRGSGCRRGSAARGTRPCSDAYLKRAGRRARRIGRRASGGAVPGYEDIEVGTDASLLFGEFLCDDRSCVSGASSKVLVNNGRLTAANIGGFEANQSSSGGAPMTIAFHLNGQYMALVDICNGAGDSSGCEVLSDPASYYVRFGLVPAPSAFSGPILDVGVKCPYATPATVDQTSADPAASDSGDGAFIAGSGGGGFRLIWADGGACTQLDAGARLNSPAFQGSSIVYAKGTAVHVYDTGTGTNRVAGHVTTPGGVVRTTFERDSGFWIGGTNGDPVIGWHETRKRRGGHPFEERNRVMRLSNGQIRTLGSGSTRGNRPALTPPDFDGTTAVWAKNGSRRSSIVRRTVRF